MIRSQKEKIVQLILELPSVKSKVPQDILNKIHDYKTLKASKDPYIQIIVFALESNLTNAKASYDAFTRQINLM